MTVTDEQIRDLLRGVLVINDNNNEIEFIRRIFNGEKRTSISGEYPNINYRRGYKIEKKLKEAVSLHWGVSEVTYRLPMAIKHEVDTFVYNLLCEEVDEKTVDEVLRIRRDIIKTKTKPSHVRSLSDYELLDLVKTKLGLSNRQISILTDIPFLTVESYSSGRLGMGEQRRRSFEIIAMAPLEFMKKVVGIYRCRNKVPDPLMASEAGRNSNRKRKKAKKTLLKNRVEKRDKEKRLRDRLDRVEKSKERKILE